MSTPIRLLPEARVEFDEATDWYEQQRAGLGTTFVLRVREVLNRIASNPQQSPTVYLDVRKVLVMKFPYVILYRDASEEILVVSVFHTSRDPKIWQARV